jgi:hypothetical protein
VPRHPPTRRHPHLHQLGVDRHAGKVLDRFRTRPARQATRSRSRRHIRSTPATPDRHATPTGAAQESDVGAGETPQWTRCHVIRSAVHTAPRNTERGWTATLPPNPARCTAGTHSGAHWS